MAPNLSLSQHGQSEHMILSQSLTASDIAKVVGCTSRTVKRHRANLRCFGTTAAPCNPGGRPSILTPVMVSELCEHLFDKPDEDLDGMVIWLWDEFEILASRWSIRRALSSAGWSMKAIRCIAKGRNADLRDYYQNAISEFPLYQRVYVDESGCDKRIGFRRWG